MMRAELGKVEKQEVILENPSNKEVRVSYRLSNINNFDIFPDTIIIPPFESIPVSIRYIPSDLDVTEVGEITFMTEEIGNWYFVAFGLGLPPTKYEPKLVAGALNKDVSGTINFKNPFKEPINVIISMEAEGKSRKVFDLLLKKTKTTINGFSMLQIPFSFKPREISEFYAELVITMNEKIAWRYPLRGVTESTSLGTDFNFKTKCRAKLEQPIEFVLPGLADYSKDEVFNHEMDGVSPEYQANIAKWFQMTPIKNTLDGPDDKLSFNVRFLPMKPFKTSFEILIFKSRGGRWKFRVNVEATEPDVDDTIYIEAPINRTVSVSFKLTNTKYKVYADFVAGFTPESDSEFSVMPKTGLLEPYGKDGTTFTISFTPVEYGKVKKGVLIIQTDEMYWSYLVRGTFPEYKKPEPKGGKIDQSLDPQLMKMLSHQDRPKKNFVVDNIKGTSLMLSLIHI
eukprot:TRINITY_DN8583_c0_g1_i5.p1 TRINITY_DN8583_c0_g1~~TRINITY_DN8583_c0_g1_i5.p1  ORF type:complete len:454 (+),score=135.08 TRINITY_DN8583_c0_g1_i5:255-1616(+)